MKHPQNGLETALNKQTTSKPKMTLKQPHIVPNMALKQLKTACNCPETAQNCNEKAQKWFQNCPESGFKKPKMARNQLVTTQNSIEWS